MDSAEPLKALQQHVVDQEDDAQRSDGKAINGFFFVEAALLEVSADWTFHEMLLYLLSCRGYHPLADGSGYGEKGSHDVVGLTRSVWLASIKSLERRGVIRFLPQKTHPVTVIASLAKPFSEALQLTTSDYRQHNGHVWDDLSEANVDLIKIPWRAMDVDRMHPEARIGAVKNLTTLRLLVWLYSEAEHDGWIPSNRLWLAGEPRPVGQVGLETLARFEFTEAEVVEAVDELMALGLIFHEKVDANGRGILYLTHALNKTTDASDMTIAA